SAAPVDLTTVRRDNGLPVTGSQPNSAQPSQSSEPANVADIDPPATDQDQGRTSRPNKPSQVEQKPPPETQTPPPPPADPDPTPEERELRKKLAQRIEQFKQDWKDNAGTGKPKPSQGGENREPKADVKEKGQSGTSGQQNSQGLSGGGDASSGSSPSNSSGSG
ncbi:MAG: hypothetical protein ACRDTJ_13855, partial [Pseudonocardiaceae bacterium]